MPKYHPDPPELATRFLRWYCRAGLLDEVEGDLYELFQRRVKEQGVWKAKALYWLNVFMFLHPDYIRKNKESYPVNHAAMFRNYFKISFRNLTKNKGYSLINIGGLAIGMAVAMLIGLWVYDELSINQYHQNYDRIAQVMRHEMHHGVKYTNTAHVTGLGTLLKSEYGSYFEHVVMVRAGVEERVIASGEKKFTQNGYFMQPEGVEMLSLKMIYGSREGLTDIHSILLSESLAKKIFGDTDPMNEIVTMDARWDLKVAGVYEDLPKNSTFHEATYFAPLDLYLDGWATLDAWDNYHMYIYVQLAPQADFKQVSAVIKDVMLPHVNEETVRSKPEVFLLPMHQWHLRAKFDNGIQVISEPMKFVWFYSIIGIFVLLLACINFMNLSTARSEKRAKEVGIRKAIGSMRSQLIGQFLVESLQVAAFAFVLALVLAALVLPWFNAIAGKEMHMLWANPWFWLAGIGFTLLTALLAGSYPAFYLSSFNPVRALKRSFRIGRLAAVPRKVLVVIQFTVSIALIIGTLIVYQQIQFAKNRPVGYAGDGLLTLQMRSPEFEGKYEVLRNELKQTGVVAEIAEANYPLTNAKGWNGGFEWKGKDPAMDTSFNTIFVTHEYGETVGWDLIEGRDFSREFASDNSGIIINESALKVMGLENPVGEIISWNPGWREAGEFQILGVIKDMVKASPFEPTYPSIIFLSEEEPHWLFIKINQQVSASEALPKIEAVFKELVPSAPFNYRFVDDEYAAKFAAEERIGKLAGFFAGLAIFISCLGLFGLASFVAEQSTKEIGIRKVLGASVTQLWGLLSKDFVVLVMLSCLIAMPVAYYLLDAWLQNYEYRTQLSWWIFAAAGMSGLLITLLTVSFQSIKAALANPVNSLRNE